MQFCCRCHKKGELVMWMPSVGLCKACSYRLTEMLNFLEHYGFVLQKQAEEIKAFGPITNDLSEAMKAAENNAKDPAKA